ncbi:tail fiber assembly protein [Sporomusa aerivorans]|uniref:tail fiber assembly protein n=1 Tax=Sporomusa aerivorans TaxID=204936 RepID=UPI00352AA162
MQYYAKFDGAGVRLTSLVEGVHFQRVKNPIYNTEAIETVIGQDTETGADIIEIAEAGTVITGYNDDTFEGVPDGYVAITEDEQNLYATGQYIRDMETGKPVPKPEYVPTAEEKLTAIRAKRDQLLSETDKYMLSDYPITDVEREAWKAYRQALRDMPETCDTDNPIWPVKPE